MKKLIPVVLSSILQMALFAQTQRTVLFEEFSGENCAPCAAINPDVRDFVEQHSSEVIILKYQVNIPSAGPLYNHNKTDANSRRTYYSVNSAPWGQQDGQNYASSTNHHPYYWLASPSNLANRYAVPSPFSITADHLFSEDGDSFYLAVNIQAYQPLAASGNSKLKLRVAMVENLTFETPPGNNGETEFHNAMRKMYPNALGTTLANNWFSGNAQQFDFSGPVPAYIYDKTEISFIVFIQDDGTKEVHQSAASTHQKLVNDAAALGVPAKFYNCTADFTPTFKLGNSGTNALTSADIDVYVDNVYNASVNWAGSLAVNSSMNVSLPTINTNAGTHNLTVVVSNPNGYTDANKGKDTSRFAFAVSPAIAAAPLVEGFETGTGNVAVENPDADAATWVYANVGSSSSKSYRMDFYLSPAGSIDYLYLPRINLVGFTGAMLTFDRAYSPYPYSGGNSEDQLDVQVSKDCGSTWQLVYSKKGADLRTSDTTYTSAYNIPKAGDWQNDNADISYGANSPDVLIRFKGISEYGNNLLLDNVNITQFGNVVSGIKETALGNLSVYPNPATDVLNVNFTLGKQALVAYEVTNALGQKVFAGRSDNNAGDNLISINTRSFINGVYFLSLVAEGNTTVKKFTVNK